MTKTGLNVTTEQEIKDKWGELLDYAKQHATDHGWNSCIKWLQQAFNEYLSMSDEVPGYGMGGAPGIKHNREVLAERIDHQEDPRRHAAPRQSHEHGPHQQAVADESQHAERPDMGVFHNPEDGVAVAASTEAVAEVGQSILVESTRQEHTARQGKHHADRRGTAEQRGAPEDESHHAARQPTGQRPQRHDMPIVLGLHLAQPPQGQAGEEGEGGHDALRSIS